MMLKMRREGDFHTNFLPTGDQCGQRAQAIYRYLVEIECDEQALDSRGFILDNHDVQKYFDITYRMERPAISCERIAMRACRDFKAMLKGKHLKRLAVTVYGNPQAGLTAEWVNEDKPTRAVSGLTGSDEEVMVYGI